jgi:arsenate reductase
MERKRNVLFLCTHNRRCPYSWPGVYERLFWPFEDPDAVQGSQEEKLEKFRQVRDRIEQRIKLWLAEIRERELQGV